MSWVAGVNSSMVSMYDSFADYRLQGASRFAAEWEGQRLCCVSGQQLVLPCGHIRSTYHQNSELFTKLLRWSTFQYQLSPASALYLLQTFSRSPLRSSVRVVPVWNIHATQQFNCEICFANEAWHGSNRWQTSCAPHRLNLTKKLATIAGRNIKLHGFFFGGGGAYNYQGLGGSD